MTSVVSGQCVLTLLYSNRAGQGQVLAQQLYTFPGPTATFSDLMVTQPLAGSWIFTGVATLSEPICPSSGACSWSGFVVVEPAGVGCPPALAPGSGPAALWAGPARDSPGTESGTVSEVWDWDTSPAGFDWCGYIDGPGAPAAGAGLAGEWPVTSPPPPVTPAPASPPTPTSSGAPNSKPKYTMTLSNLRTWVWSAAVEQFYGSRTKTKLAVFRVKECRSLSSGRFRCTLSWQKKPYAFAGTATVGNLNPTTGSFRFGLSIVRRDQATGARKRINIPY